METPLSILISTFPRLFRDEEPQCASGFPGGWFPIVSNLFEQIDEMLDDELASRFRVAQVKEKFGGLRVYVEMDEPKPKSAGLILLLDSPLPPQRMRSPEQEAELLRSIRLLISEATERSTRTCQSCGRPGELRRVTGMPVRCDRCFLKYMAIDADSNS
jgi:hypothetical protein